MDREFTLAVIRSNVLGEVGLLRLYIYCQDLMSD